MLEYPEGFDHARDRKRPICGVLAVAFAADVPFDVAFAACKRNMVAGQKRFRGATYDEQREAALRELGVEFVVNKVDFNLTVARFVRECATPGKTYMLEVSGHVVTVRGDMVADQGQIRHFDLHKCRQRRVKRVVTVVSNQPLQLAA